MKPDGFPGNLSPLQQDLVRELGGGAGAGFFLTGSAALVGYYGHRRIRVRRGGEETLVERVLDEVPAVHGPQALPGSALAIDVAEEIAVNKICALVGRGEPRDLEDLQFLASAGVDLEEAIRLAGCKDAGVGPDTLLMVLPQVPVSEGARAFRDELARRLRMELLPP